MKLQLTHHTRYDYLPAVETAQHMGTLRWHNGGGDPSLLLLQ